MEYGTQDNVSFCDRAVCLHLHLIHWMKHRNKDRWAYEAVRHQLGRNSEHATVVEEAMRREGGGGGRGHKE